MGLRSQLRSDISTLSRVGSQRNRDSATQPLFIRTMISSKSCQKRHISVTGTQRPRQVHTSACSARRHPTREQAVTTGVTSRKTFLFIFTRAQVTQRSRSLSVTAIQRNYFTLLTFARYKFVTYLLISQRGRSLP